MNSIRTLAVSPKGTQTGAFSVLVENTDTNPAPKAHGFAYRKGGIRRFAWVSVYLEFSLRFDE